MNLTNKLKLELELCPFLKTCCPEDEMVIEDYCSVNYENCEKYLKYKKDNKYELKTNYENVNRTSKRKT